MKSGVPGPEGSLGKWHWAEINQHLMELAFEIQGPYSQFDDESEYAHEGDWQYQYLRTRANSIEGGTTDILRNIVAERVLGLPKLR
jgi:alkylation response protein AidB-like acyl-CoA dehydrogenase